MNNLVDEALIIGDIASYQKYNIVLVNLMEVNITLQLSLFTFSFSVSFSREIRNIIMCNKGKRIMQYYRKIVEKRTCTESFE